MFKACSFIQHLHVKEVCWVPVLIVSRVVLCFCICICMYMEPGSFQCHPVSGQEAMSTNGSTGDPI